MGRNRQEIKQKMASNFVQIKKAEIPEGFSPEFADFTNKLLEKSIENRLGSRTIEQLKNHPWLKYTDWKKLYLMKEKPLFIPPKKIIISDEEVKEEIKVNLKPINSEINKIAFKDFLYFNKFSKQHMDNLNKNNNQFINPHSYYEEVERKEEEFKHLVSKMDAELKKEKEKLKEKESHRRKSIGISKNININYNRIYNKRGNNNINNIINDKEEFKEKNFNPIRIKIRKQSYI